MPIAIATCWLSATARMAMPDAALQEEPGEAGEEDEADPGAHELDRRQHDRARTRSARRRSAATIARVSPPKASDRRQPRSTAASPIVAMTTAMTGRPISGRSTTRSRPKPKRDHAGDRDSDAETQNGAPGDAERAGRDEAGEHDELALGEVDGVGRLVDQHEAERDQRVHQADHDPVGQQHQRELPFELRHRRSRSSPDIERSRPPRAAALAAGCASRVAERLGRHRRSRCVECSDALRPSS